MNLKHQPPVFVPFEFRAEIESMSKAALMDMVWDFAFERAGEMPDAAMTEIRKRREIIDTHRKQAKAS